MPYNGNKQAFAQQKKFLGKTYFIFLLSPITSVKVPVANCLGKVFGQDMLTSRQVGYSTAYPKYPVIGTG